MAQTQRLRVSSAADPLKFPAVEKPSKSLSRSAGNYETAILTENGKAEAWDWQASGTMEMNCFLCHLEITQHRGARRFHPFRRVRGFQYRHIAWP